MRRLKAFGIILVLVALGCFTFFVTHKPAAANYSTIQVSTPTPTQPPIFFGGGSGLPSNSASPTTSPNVESSSNLQLGLFWDKEATISATEISWGTIVAGGSSSKTLYLKNLGVEALLIEKVIFISLICRNAAQEIITGYEKYFSVSLSCIGIQLNSQDIVEGVISLSISKDISEVASFDAQISVVVNSV